MAQRGYECLLAGGEGGLRGAVAIFERALRRDPASPYRWCDLGEVLLEAGRNDTADRCITRALELGPHSPPILMRAANFYYRVGDNGRAFACAGRIFDMAEDFDAAIFNLYEHLDASVEEVLRRGLPASKRAVHSYFRHLLATAPATPVQKAWHWIDEHSLADDAIAEDYLTWLLRARQYETASMAWAAYTAPQEPDYLKSNYVYNGSFERSAAGTVFDWSVSAVDGAEATRDCTFAASGKWSLCIRFRGTENVAYNHVSQRTVVRPGLYRFEAGARAAEITTDEGVGFIVVDAEAPQRLALRTERILGTTGWTRVGRTFRVPLGTRLLEIRVVRDASLKFDNKISGTIWIDAVVLARFGEDGGTRSGHD